VVNTIVGQFHPGFIDQPVAHNQHIWNFLAMEKMKAMQQGEMVIMVDTQASKENLSRAVQSQGWEVKEILEDGEEFHLRICSK